MQNKLIKIKVNTKLYNKIKDGFMPFLLLDERENANTGDTIFIYPDTVNKPEGKHLTGFVINEMHYYDANVYALRDGYMAVTLKAVREIGN